MSRLRQRVLRLALVGVLVLALCAAAFAGWTWQQWRRPFAGWAGTSVDVMLEPGMSARAMIRRLAEVGVIERPWVVRLQLALNGAGEALHAGEYRFDQAATPRDVLARLRVSQALERGGRAAKLRFEGGIE